MAEEGGGGGEEKQPFWQAFMPSWLRRGRKVNDISNIPTAKLVEAHQQRGIEIVPEHAKPGEPIPAEINKVVVEGDDQPKP